MIRHRYRAASLLFFILLPGCVSRSTGSPLEIPGSERKIGTEVCLMRAANLVVVLNAPLGDKNSFEVVKFLHVVRGKNYSTRDGERVGLLTEHNKLTLYPFRTFFAARNLREFGIGKVRQIPSLRHQINSLVLRFVETWRITDIAESREERHGMSAQNDITGVRHQILSLSVYPSSRSIYTLKNGRLSDCHAGVHLYPGSFSHSELIRNGLISYFLGFSAPQRRLGLRFARASLLPCMSSQQSSSTKTSVKMLKLNLKLLGRISGVSLCHTKSSFRQIVGVPHFPKLTVVNECANNSKNYQDCCSYRSYYIHQTSFVKLQHEPYPDGLFEAIYFILGVGMMISGLASFAVLMLFGAQTGRSNIAIAGVLLGFACLAASVFFLHMVANLQLKRMGFTL